MITLKKAFEIASKNSNGVTLSPQAYDLGESWAFDYGGTDEINGFFPVINGNDHTQFHSVISSRSSFFASS